jgi:polyisoprenyl-phosphate glycosyltransferase
MSNIHISVVSPVYKGQFLTDRLIAEVIRHVRAITEHFEIILVEDGSPDQSWEVIERNCAANAKVKGIKLSRNFGQHYAITAGLEAAAGEWIIVMDCDLQDRPDQIPLLYAACSNADIVCARRTNRTDGPLKKISSHIFYMILSYLTESKQDKAVANFGIYHRKAIAAVLAMKDHIRYFPTMIQWVGFRRVYVDVEHGERENEKSSYTIRKLIHLAFNNMIAFSDRPLQLAVTAGLCICGLATVLGVYYLIQFINGRITEPGFTSLIISLWFLSGVIIFILGIVGIYVGKVFERVKGRPIYLVDQKINLP